MRRTQGILLLIILMLAPFMREPVWHFCAMRPGVPQASCCCGQESGGGSDCCRLIPVPAGEQLSSAAPGISPPDFAGMMFPVLSTVGSGIGFEQSVERWDHAPPRTPNSPLFLLHSSFLS